MKKLSLITATLGIAALAAVNSQAEAPEGKKRPDKPVFEGMDTDNDGVVTKEEFVKARTEQIDKMFAKLDKNSDGKITKDEVPDGPRKRRKEAKAGEGETAPPATE